MHLDVILIIDMKSLHMVLNRVIQFELKFVIIYEDSYIAAEEATKGCSSLNTDEKNCITSSSLSSSSSSSSSDTNISSQSYSFAPNSKVEVSGEYYTAVTLICISLTTTVNIIVFKIFSLIVYFLGCHCC